MMAITGKTRKAAYRLALRVGVPLLWCSGIALLRTTILANYPSARRGAFTLTD